MTEGSRARRIDVGMADARDMWGAEGGTGQRRAREKRCKDLARSLMPLQHKYAGVHRIKTLRQGGVGMTSESANAVVAAEGVDDAKPRATRRSPVLT